MSKVDKLRNERAELIAKLKRERDDELACHAEVQRQINDLEARRAKKKADLITLAVESEKTLAELDRKIARAAAEEKKQQLLEVARQIDEAETPEKWMRFDKLCCEIPNKQSYELRSMNRRRMKSDKDVAALGRPYPNVHAWAAAMTGA
jgi:hypothetical protein